MRFWTPGSAAGLQHNVYLIALSHYLMGVLGRFGSVFD